jgi:hypothetical protein
VKRAVLSIPGTPPSYNTLVHAHWRKNQRAKQDWQQRCEIVLLEARVPRGLQLVTATALIHHKQFRRRDEGNFRVVLEKALGDALTNGGWLPDDTPDHYRFERLRFTSPSSTAPLTEVTLAFR